MLIKFLLGFCLIAVTVVIHLSALVSLVRYALRTMSTTSKGYLNETLLLIKVTWFLILSHLCQIIIWAWFYWQKGLFAEFDTAIYFSGVTYSTIGYGDLVLPADWRIFGPIEGLVGILMCGISAAFFFALISRFYSKFTVR